VFQILKTGGWFLGKRNIINMIYHDRRMVEGACLFFKWQSFIPDPIYALNLFADEEIAMSIQYKFGLRCSSFASVAMGMKYGYKLNSASKGPTHWR
jgi:hypothetical protein